MVRTVRGRLITKQRGKLSMDDVVERSGNAFTKASVYGWEKELYKPSVKNLLELLKALDCKYEDISEPLELKKQIFHL